jgi:hypothetical protein
VRGLFALMLAFVFLIGPINFFWLARPGKKIRMLWTVPVISLFTCLAVSGFALFGEGVKATTRTEVFTILDEAAHRATTIGWMAFYSPVTPGDGLHFNYDTELIPLGLFEWNSGNNRSMDFSKDQQLESGWIAARIPTFFKFRKSELRRERLTVTPTPGNHFSVVNGLGAKIEKLWYADHTGRVHSTEGIEAGAQANLKNAMVNATGGPEAFREILREHDWLERMNFVSQNAERFLMPGTYLALLDRAPFVEPGLSNVKEHKARTLVFGIGARER